MSTCGMKTREEIENLKAQWEADPCWDICQTEGFEDHADELYWFQQACEEKWDRARSERLEARAKLMDLTVAGVIEIERLENKIAYLEEQIEKKIVRLWEAFYDVNQP